jgi:phosphocarrier protein FPr
MVQLSAVAGGLLKNKEAVDTDFVAELATKEPTHLGQGLWLVSSDKAVSRTAMSFVSTSSEFKFKEQPVKALIAFSACNNAHHNMLETLSQLVFQKKQTAIIEARNEELLTFFSGEDEADAVNGADGNSAVYIIKNAHGLHARPGAMLVAEAKKFESNIKVANLSGDGKTVNAKSLMKVIAMGVKKGHELQFTADGADAQDALKSIGAAIEAGLGEA